MKERRSVRSFNGEPLSGVMKTELAKIIGATESPFGGNVTIKLKDFDLNDGFKPSTYGMIRGASDFFLMAMDNDMQSALSAGYRFEQVVLKTWQLGLGTCWIAATFKGTDFDRDTTWPSGQRLRIVSPVGVAAKPSIKEKIARMAVGSNSRKPFGELFFNSNFDHPLEADSRYATALEMMRLAPSSTNSQPWRAVVDNSTIHFYYKPKSSLSVLDCGIGLCHFCETLKFYDIDGNFSTNNNAPAPPTSLKYLISFDTLS